MQRHNAWLPIPSLKNIIKLSIYFYIPADIKELVMSFNRSNEKFISGMYAKALAIQKHTV